MAQYLPPGPLSAYLGVRNTNEAADMEKFGLLARLQQAEQARRESEAFRRDQLAARVEGQQGAIQSRELIAGQADARQREMTKMQLDFQEGNAKRMHDYRMAGLRGDAERQAETARHNKAMEEISKLRTDIAGAKVDAGGLSGESAGKIAMADQAVLDLQDAKSILFDENGEIKRDIVAAMNIPFTAGMPGNTNARNAYSKIHNSVAAKLRIETGAAATESEVRGILDRFLPKVLDPTSVAKDRLDRLEEFMNTTIDQTKGVRMDQLRSRKPKPTATPSPSGVPSFASEAEAAAANLKPGTRVRINGVLGTWQ